MGEILLTVLSLLPAKVWVSTLVLTAVWLIIKGMAGGKNRDVRTVMPVRFWVWRFLTGQHLDGYKRTNCTFRYRGNKPLGGIVRASNWQYRAGWERLAFRIAWIVVPILFGIGWFTWHTGTKVVTTIAAVATIGYYGYRIVRYIVYFHWTFFWVRPLHYAIHGHVGIRKDFKPTEYLHFPLGFRNDPDSVGRIDLPMHFSGNELQSRKALASSVAGKLGLAEVDIVFNLESNTPHALVKHVPAPPSSVLYAEVKDVIANTGDDAPFLGYGPRGKAVHVSLDSESPHVLVSAGTGAGKSALLRAIGSQALAKGAGLVICDIKRVSHKWAKGLPHVAYCRTAEEIHEALIAAQTEVNRRYEIIDAAEDEDNADVGPRLYILLEEMNATIRVLESYWRKVRTSDDPKVSPAVEAIGNILFMGRAAKMHVIAVAQMATARSLGGPEARENFATRILARATNNAWKMLVPEIPYLRQSRHAGRVYVAIAGEAIETQIVFITVEEARELAQSNVPIVFGPELSDAIEASDSTTAIEERVTLKRAVELEWVGLSYEALRKARQRDSFFPKGVNGKYTRNELVEWVNARDRVTVTAPIPEIQA